ncbi:TPA: hypothetical protein ACPY23_000508 [Klebsiella oxytoca]
MTNNQLTDERIEKIAVWLATESHSLNLEMLTCLRELQERRKADSEPVVFTDERNLHHIAMGRETSLIWGKQNSETGDVPLYRHAQQPVVDADDNFYSWFGREWQENYQHNQYTTAAKQMLGVMAESAWIAATERQRQKQSVSVPDVKIYEDVPYEVGRFKTHRDCYCDGWNACRAAMLQAGYAVRDLSTPVDPQVAEYEQNVMQAGNSPVIGIDLASGPDRTVEVRYVAPPGYVIVPKEPTRQMMSQGHFAMKGTDRGKFRRIYQAMIAAAQQEMMKDEANNLSPK